MKIDSSLSMSSQKHEKYPIFVYLRFRNIFLSTLHSFVRMGITRFGSYNFGFVLYIYKRERERERFHRGLIDYVCAFDYLLHTLVSVPDPLHIKHYLF